MRNPLLYGYVVVANRLHRLARDQRGVAVIEYAILLGVIVGVVFLAVTNFGNQISTAINGIAGRVTSTVGSVGST